MAADRSVPAPAPPPGAPPIVFFTTTGWLGGAERSLLELAGELRGRGRAVHGLFPGPGGLSQAWTAAGLTCDRVQFPPVTRKTLQNPFSLPNVAGETVTAFDQLATRLLAAAQPAGPVILVANSIPAVLFAGLLPKVAPRAQPAIAATLWHCRDLPERAQLGTSFGAAVFPQLRKAIAISDTVARGLIVAGLPPEKLTVIRNGIALPAVNKGARTAVTQRAARGSFGLQLDRPTVLQIAQFTPWKKTPLFLEACRVAAAKRPLQVLLVGRDPDADADDPLPMTLRVTLDRLKSANLPVVHRADLDPAGIDQAFRAADLLVHTAVGEPFGRVVLEAMARGVPVLCRGGIEGGGPAELIAHEKTGWKVDYDDGFAPAIVELLGDEARLAALGAAAQAEALRVDGGSGLPTHSTARVAAELLALLQGAGL